MRGGGLLLATRGWLPTVLLRPRISLEATPLPSPLLLLLLPLLLLP